MKPPVDQSLDTDSGGWFTLLEVNFIVFETSASCLMLIGNHSSFTGVERWSEIKMRTPPLQELTVFGSLASLSSAVPERVQFHSCENSGKDMSHIF